MQSLDNVNDADLIGLPATLKTLDCSWCSEITKEGIEGILFPVSSISKLYMCFDNLGLDWIETAIRCVSKTGNSLKLLVHEVVFYAWEESMKHECNEECDEECIHSILAKLEANFEVVLYEPVYESSCIFL